MEYINTHQNHSWNTSTHSRNTERTHLHISKFISSRSTDAYSLKVWPARYKRY